jgi:hypothetical protein
MWGSCGVIIVNLFAARSTNPNELFRIDDKVGPFNDAFIQIACSMAPRVVCAWGTHDLAYTRYRRALDIMQACGALPVCLGRTTSGLPRHPLYVPKVQPLEHYNV